MHIQPASAGAGLLVPEWLSVFVRRLAADIGRQRHDPARESTRVARRHMSRQAWAVARPRVRVAAQLDLLRSAVGARQ